MLTIQFTNEALVCISILAIIFIPQIHLFLIIFLFGIGEISKKLITFITNFIIPFSFVLFLFTLNLFLNL